MASCAFQNGFPLMRSYPHFTTLFMPIGLGKEVLSKHNAYRGGLQNDHRWPTGRLRDGHTKPTGRLQMDHNYRIWAGHRNGGPWAQTVIEYRVPLVTAVT